MAVILDNVVGHMQVQLEVDALNSWRALASHSLRNKPFSLRSELTDEKVFTDNHFKH